jgi:YD repeat-containing protein
VDTDGIIITIAGNGTYGYGGDGGPPTEAELNYPVGVTVDVSNNLYIGDRSNQRVRKVPPFSIPTALATNGELAFAEENGLGYILDSCGRHKKTIDLDTGIILYQFGYDQNNKLVSIADRFGNQTIISRNSNGVPTSITSPDGITTALTIDSNNNLTRITYPDGNFYSFEYTPSGLLTAKVEPKGNRFEHAFDSIGRLTDATDQEGGDWQFSRQVYINSDVLAQILTAEGNLTSYLDHTDSTGAYTSHITDPSGAETVYTSSADGLTANKTLPCGMNLSFKYGVDSQYKFNFVKEMREKASSGLERVTLREKTYQDTNSDGTPGLITEKVTLNGKATTLVNNTLQSKSTMTSPTGRTITTFYDPNNLLNTRLTIPGLYETNFGYDTRGRLTSITTNTRQTVFGYDSQGNLSFIADPENHTTSYTYDSVGRLSGILRPDNSLIGFAYDKNGNMTVLTNPSAINHGFGYNQVNLNSSYQTPLSGTYSYLYNRDRRLLQWDFESNPLIHL